MMPGNNDDFFESVFLQAFGKPLSVQKMEMKPGGCINNTVMLQNEEGKFFLKWNEQADPDMFAAEARGLELLAGARAIRIPEVIFEGEAQGKRFLLLEYIEPARPNADFWQSFGQQLAQLHRQTDEQYGLDHSNFIGRLPQKNTPKNDWVDFFIECRLNVQIGLALYEGKVNQRFVDRFKSIYPLLDGLIPNEPPALLHGDLWSGNFMVDDKGQPCLFDPAVYYGSREMELAFTTLFGGFDDKFYQTYQEVYPMENGFYDRIPIYNLYPLLVHVNLFGTSYLSGVERTVDRLLG